MGRSGKTPDPRRARSPESVVPASGCRRPRPSPACVLVGQGLNEAGAPGAELRPDGNA